MSRIRPILRTPNQSINQRRERLEHGYHAHRKKMLAPLYDEMRAISRDKHVRRQQSNPVDKEE